MTDYKLEWYQDERDRTHEQVVSFWENVSTTDPELLLESGRAFLRGGRLTEAEARFRMALKLGSQDECLPGLMGSTLFRQERPEEASSFLEKDTTGEGRLLLGGCFLQLNELSKAESLFKELLSGPLRLRALGQLAELAIRRNTPELGLAYCDEALQGHTWNASLLHLRAALLKECGRWEELSELIELGRLVVQSTILPAEIQQKDFASSLKEQMLGDKRRFFEKRDPSTESSLRLNHLLPGPEGALKLLTELVHQECECYFARFGDTLPWGQPPALPLKVRINGWGLVMERGGRVNEHFHALGIISGVYYVQIPANANPDDLAGCLRFGNELDPNQFQRLVRPYSGLNILFPSFYQHHSIPNGADDERIVISYDVMPVKK